MSESQIMQALKELSDLTAGLYTRVEEVGTQMYRLETTVQGLETKVHGLETTVQGLETKMHGLETTVQGLETKMHGLETTVQGLETKMHGLGTTVQGLETNLNDFRTEMRMFRLHTEKRLDQLEKNSKELLAGHQLFLEKYYEHDIQIRLLKDMHKENLVSKKEATS
ncbi:hypothetical protein NSQ26_04195 [Bacillus sp. FSL W7-1360]